MRITQPTAVGLIATHALVSSGVHGATGTICGLSDTQTLTNKSIGAGGLTFINEGAGGNPVFASSSSATLLQLTGDFRSTLNLIFASATAFYATFDHANSSAKTYTLPNSTGTLLITGNINQSAYLTQLNIRNVGAGADPVFFSDSSVQRLDLTGEIFVSSHVVSDQNIQFESATAFRGIFEHAISASRTWTFPDIAGTLCMWNAANAAVTRYYSKGAYGIFGEGFGNSGTWTFEGSEEVRGAAGTAVFYLGVNLPHGAIVTAWRVGSQKINGGDVCEATLWRTSRLGAGNAEIGIIAATTSEEEVSDTSMQNATIDNNLYSYFIEFARSGANDVWNIKDIQIDYTVTEPYP